MKILLSDAERDIATRGVVGVAVLMKLNRKQKKPVVKILNKLKNITGLISLKPKERAYVSSCLTYVRNALVEQEALLETQREAHESKNFFVQLLSKREEKKLGRVEESLQEKLVVLSSAIEKLNGK